MIGQQHQVDVHGRVIDFIAASGLPHRQLAHPACRTSAESAAARAGAGAPGSVGAKALVVKTGAGFAMLVLPGDARLASDVVRGIIGKFRFARPEEVETVTDGLRPGMIPPFAAPVFEAIPTLIVDERIGREPLIGFNSAHLERSVVMTGANYMQLVQPFAVAAICE